MIITKKKTHVLVLTFLDKMQQMNNVSNISINKYVIT